MKEKEKKEKLIELMKMSDLDFYDKFLADAPYEEQEEFFREFPEFLEEEAADGDGLEKCSVESGDILKMVLNVSNGK